MVFEVWQTTDKLWHWQLVDNGKVAHPQNSYERPIDCNNALAKVRKQYPGAEIRHVEEPTKG